jgi:hypothetical protein
LAVDRVDALMAAFSRLPQRIIVKFDVDVENPPDNVLIVKSILPQQVNSNFRNKMAAIFYTYSFGILSTYLCKKSMYLDQSNDHELHMYNARVAKNLQRN